MTSKTIKNIIRNIIRALLLTSLIMYAGYSIYYLFTAENNPTYLDCGKIISKSSDEVAIKHGSQTELYLNIQFKETGFKSQLTSPTTYFAYKVDDYVCFDLNKKMPVSHAILKISGLIFTIIIAIILIVLLSQYLAPDSWSD